MPSVRTVKRWFTQRERNTLLPQISSPDMKMPPWLPLFMQYYGRPSKPSAQDAYRLFLPALAANMPDVNPKMLGGDEPDEAAKAAASPYAVMPNRAEDFDAHNRKF